MLDINVINALAKDGWKRWTKGDYDRLYFNLNHTDHMEVTYHKSGWVASAKLDGEEISNSQASRIMGVKCWIDVETGKLYIRYGRDDAQETVKKYAEKSLEKAQNKAAESED